MQQNGAKIFVSELVLLTRIANFRWPMSQGFLELSFGVAA